MSSPVSSTYSNRTGMPDGNGFYPPAQFSPLWFILGIVLILAVIGWYIFLIWFTRKRALREATGAPWTGLPQQGPSLAQTYLTLIDEVERASADGLLEFREAHQRLSLLVREFAANARGIRAPYMTLEDLRATQLGALTFTVGQLYPGAFSGSETGSVGEAAERARKLVREWR